MVLLDVLIVMAGALKCQRDRARVGRGEFHTADYLPGEPVAHNYGLLYTSNGLLRGRAAYIFQLLGCPGRVYIGS